MNGVEILSSKTMYNTILPEWCLIVGLILAITCLVFTMILFGDRYNIAGTLCAILMIIGMIMACLGAISNKIDINHIEYKVTIDDSVSMNEFLDKYEILDQEGKIYTVREKN
jgi:flagellar motor component MotA